MRYLVAVFLSVILLLPSLSAFSHRGGHVDLKIISESNNEFFTIPYRESRKGRTTVIKKYLEARKGENYSLVVRNRTADRVGVVVAVDGRNIISGKKSFLTQNESMYIVQPYGKTSLNGWRTDQNNVHKFYFTDQNDSYTVKTFQDKSAIGVIAVAVFREKKRQAVPRERHLKDEHARNAPSAPAREGKLKSFESDIAGTGFGDKQYSPAVTVQFEPENIPSEKILVRYEWNDVLCKKGLLKCWTEEKNRLWDEDELIYAPYPPDYVE
jgi:hypothetical protein